MAFSDGCLPQRSQGCSLGVSNNFEYRYDQSATDKEDSKREKELTVRTHISKSDFGLTFRTHISKSHLKLTFRTHIFSKLAKPDFRENLFLDDYACRGSLEKQEAGFRTSPPSVCGTLPQRLSSLSVDLIKSNQISSKSNEIKSNLIKSNQN